MNRIFLLSGENLDLARQEILTLAKKPKGKQIDKLFILDCDFKFDRLAFTHKVCDLLFECEADLNKISESMKKIDWNKIFRRDFCVRAHNDKIKIKKTSAELEKYFAGFVWENLEKPKVNLRNPGTLIEIYLIKDKAYCGKRIFESKQQFYKRKAHLRPEMSPVSLSPKLARAMVNLSGIKSGHTLIDPFCGCGGILIEAGLMRFRVVGYDINEIVLRKCRKNLESFMIRRFKLEKRDATNITENLDYVVTDLPYGKASKLSEPLEKLYLDFAKVLKKNLINTAVVGYPNFIDFKQIIKKNNIKLKIKYEFKMYIHKSLTKKIVVVEK